MPRIWTESGWQRLDDELRREILSVSTARNCDDAWYTVSRRAREVLRHYSSSFFLVTRFLPPAKRIQVEIIYAAVRYPDEIVDTFPLPPETQLALLDQWRAAYDAALQTPDLACSLRNGIPCFLAAFAEVVRRNNIPHQYYRAFLTAMKRDAVPRPFANLPDLIDNYIYGSATVVGYFLAYVYGPSSPDQFPRTLQASRSLGIALQLTNFLRDVTEDHQRGRNYLPLDLLADEGIECFDRVNPFHIAGVHRVIQRLSEIAAGFYSDAEVYLDAFAPDSRTAIRACIGAYGELNTRIGPQRPHGG